MAFTSNINTLGAGGVNARDDSKLYNTDKEKNLLQPPNEVYYKLAQECIRDRVTVDLYYAVVSPQKSVDLATTSILPTQTGGDLHYICPFDVNKHGEKLHYEIFRALTRTTGTDVQIKARVSQGLTVAEYFGGFSYKEQPDIVLSSIDADKTIGFLIRNDEKLKDNTLAFVQFAMLYTSQYGERRIRVFNQSMQLTKNLNGYFKAADVETLSDFQIRRYASRVATLGPKATKEAIINNLVTLLHTYRQKCAA
jgi:protein transport protein SEC24